MNSSEKCQTLTSFLKRQFVHVREKKHSLSSVGYEGVHLYWTRGGGTMYPLD